MSRSFSENSPVSAWLPCALTEVKAAVSRPIVAVSEGQCLVFLRREEAVILTACVDKECSGMLVVEILDKIYKSLEISGLTLETTKTEGAQVQMRLDEILPYGVFTEISKKRETSNFFGQAEIYVDVTERWEFSAGSEISTMTVAGSVEVSSKMPEKSEISMSIHSDISRFGFHPCVRRGKFLETKRRTISCVLPMSRKFLLAQYAVIGNLNSLPFVFSGAIGADGKVRLELGPAGQANLEKVELEISLPEISTGSLLCSAASASVRLDKNRILWKIGNLTGKSAVEGSLVGNLSAWTPVAQVRFLVKAWNPSGLRVESLDVACGGVKPYKGVRYNTVGSCEIRF